MRLAAAMSPTVEPAVLSLRSGSTVSELTEAVSVSDVAVDDGDTRTTTVMATVPPLAMLPRLHVTVPLACAQVPWLAVADTNVASPGRASVTTTLAAALGPAFPTVIVDVAWLPAET